MKWLISVFLKCVQDPNTGKTYENVSIEHEKEMTVTEAKILGQKCQDPEYVRKHLGLEKLGEVEIRIKPQKK